jgi:SAM-dependent methyltransferase
VGAATDVSGIERARALLTDELREGELPTTDGYIDLLPPEGLPSTGLTQDLMLSGAVPQVYERWWRPALGRVAKGVFGPGMADEKRIARLLLGLVPGDGVLDIACGTGNFTRDFARAVGPSGLVVGLDVSTTMLARAVGDTGGMEQVAYVRGDAQELAFRDKSFDAVCCFAALHLFSDPFAALDSFARVLTPGGRVAVFTSVRGRSAPLRGFERAIQAQSGMRMFEHDEVVNALLERGFDDVHQRVTGMTQFVGGRLKSASRRGAVRA